MSLRDYLKLNDAEFRALFRNSPIKRIKRRGFLRNVCVALGNVGDVADLPALNAAASIRTIDCRARGLGDRADSGTVRDANVESLLNPKRRFAASQLSIAVNAFCFAKV